MRTLGMIGGTSWHSTIEYYRYINSMVEERVGQHHTPPLLLYSLNVQLMVRGDWEEIQQSYLSICQNLEQAGAEAILICANTPHKVIPFVAPQIGIPFIHIANATGEAAQKLGLTHLGLLGTQPVMEEDFISGRISTQHGLEVQVPEELGRSRVHQVIVDELTKGIFTSQTRDMLIEEMQQMHAKGADGMILGCTELPMLIKPEHFDLPLLDTTRLHAQKAVDFILT